ncbi:guanylate kinase [Streptomyces sp. NPDC102467]|uniref:guanylate kinase n=1 Tax=Streptomyces sp. NPDC102467 TaxID=3366179 RepID=UPI0038073324
MDWASELSVLADGYEPHIHLDSSSPTRATLLLVGPSGAGKDSVKRGLLATGRYREIISHTTRAPRYNDELLEQDGIEYHFVTHEQMARLARDGKFVQFKRYGGNYYGTSSQELRRAWESGTALTDVDIQGALAFSRIALPGLLMVFLLPPGLPELLRRLESRCVRNPRDGKAAITQRVAIALREVECVISHADRFRLVVNDDLNTAVEEVDALATGGTARRPIAARRVLDTLASDIKAYLSSNSPS